MASLVTKFFTTHVGKDVGNAQSINGALDFQINNFQSMMKRDLHYVNCYNYTRVYK